MATITTTVRPGRINNGPGYPCQANVEHASEIIWSSSPKADEAWSLVDAAGHFHAYDQSADRGGDRYPTLRVRIEEIPCSYAEHDYDCTGENITHYHCRICDEEVTPRLIPGPHSFAVPGRTEWRAKLTVPAAEVPSFFGEQVSFRTETGSHELFGIAHVASVSVRDGMADIDLTGVSSLGRRAIPGGARTQ